MLGQRHELDVRVRQLVHVADQLVGQFPVTEPRAPGADVHLVDAHRTVVRVGGGPLGQPRGIRPLVVGLADDRRRLRRNLGVPGHRVGLPHPVARLREQFELVVGAGGQAGDEELPHACAAHVAHRVGDAVPAVEVADHANRLGVRSPHREGGAGGRTEHTDVVAEMRAEDVPQAFVPALADEVQVEFAEGGQVTVGVVGDPARRRLVPCLEGVVLQAHGAHTLPDAVAEVCEFDVGAVGEDREDLGGKRPEGADDDERVGHTRRVDEVLAEHPVRVVIPAGSDRVEDVVGDLRQRRLAVCSVLHACHPFMRAGWFIWVVPFMRAGPSRAGYVPGR